jgi:serine protease Do
MRSSFGRTAGAVLALAALGGAGTEGRAQYSRRTPVVEAVQKTRAGVVTIKVEKRGQWGRKDVVGTGVVVDEHGYVVTNRHVVGGADRVAVRLCDGTEVVGRVWAEDHDHDLAIIRLTTDRKLTALAFAPGSDLLVGEQVIAVGNPFGYANTVSTGIISALGREIDMPSGERLRNLIQTNASINPGNSGGPLLNINGELIGINVALREGAQGIAFALNADTVQQVLARHLSAGRVARVEHGLACREVVRDEGPARQQAVVYAVSEDGPAARAGLRRGDVLVRVGGRAVTNRFDVERALWDCKAGDRVRASVLRDGRETQLELRLTPVTEGDTTAAAAGTSAPDAGPAGNARPVNNRR